MSNVDMSGYDQQGCLHHMFIKQALQIPDRVAIVSASGSRITFGELNRVTDSLAHYLRSLGVGKSNVVGIFMERCVEYTIALIAILKAGGAYLPIEMSYPRILMESVLEDAQPVAICSKQTYACRLKDFSEIPIVNVEEEWLKTLPLCISVFEQTTLDDMAYAVFSSGTTGKPKGIQCPHRGAVFSYIWRHLAYPYKEDEREACNIFFVWEMLRPLLKGIPLYIIPDTIIYDPPELLKFLLENSITRMLFTPSLLQTILDTQPQSMVAESFKSMNQIILCGEVMKTTLRNRFASLVPWVRILNLYSISECHDVSCSDLTHGYGLEGRTYCPVGRIFPMVRAFVMDENFNENAPGVAGEIYIGGPTLAIGYINRPELNKERFINTPPHLVKRAGGRLYRTGDCGYLLSDGSLEVIGRCDSMVKIRGYTIELKAIENALSNIAEINLACVVVVGPEGSDKMLVAYIVPNNSLSSKNIGYLRTQLKSQLPFYMIPSKFIFIDKMPLMDSSGKINKEELPQVRLFSEEDIDLNGVSTDDTCKSIARIWCTVLNIFTIDVTDNFFDLGGHSLSAAVVVGKINDSFGTSLTTFDMYVNPTIEALTTKVKTGENSKLNDVNLLQELDKYLVRSIPNIRLRTLWKSVKFLKSKFHHIRILLTRAVGFLGSFIMKNLLDNTQVTLFCLVRSTANQTAEQRLLDVLKSRGLSTDLFGSKVILIQGDVSLNKFSLEEIEYSALCLEIDFVIHCAAYVNMVLPYSALSQSNVVGTRNVISFCLEGKLKPLHHISTSDVFPPGEENCTESTDMFANVTKLSRGYAQTKWVAEQIVMSASRNGLPTIVSRCGNISGCRNTGSWNKDDMNLLIIQGVLATGKAPDIPWKIEFTPVDFICDIIVKLTCDWTRTFGKIYHLINSTTMDCRKLWKILQDKGYIIKLVTYKEWREAVASFSHHSSLLKSLLQLLEGQPNADHLGNVSFFTQDNVHKYLASWNVQYPPINTRLITKYIDELSIFGLISTIQKHSSTEAPMEKSYHHSENKVAIVTGASSGIGYAIATTLARAGIITVGIARNINHLENLQKQLEAENVDRFVPMKADVTSYKEVMDCVKNVQTNFGQIDILVNNAGVMEYCKMVNVDLDSWLSQVNVNCNGFLHMLAAVLPQMKERQAGHIVNITSDAGRKPFANLAVYSGTKFFQEAVADAMRQEVAEYGIKVSNIEPGDVQRGLHLKSKDSQTRKESAYNIEYLKVEDIAEIVLFVLNQPKNCAVNAVLVEPLLGPI